MRLSFRQSLSGILLASVAASSCAEQGDADAAGSISVAPRPVSLPAPTAEALAEAPANPETAASFPLMIVNPMPHDMVVSLLREPEPVELGRVPAAGRQIFDVPVPPGSTIDLIARDEAKTHSPTTTMTLPAADDYAVWRIE